MKSLKTVLLFAMTTMLFMACAPAVTGQETITIGQAFEVCFGRMGYVIPLVVVTLLSGIGIYILLKKYKQTQDWKSYYSIALFAIAVIFFFTLLYAPAEIAANTTVEQFNRGVIINP